MAMIERDELFDDFSTALRGGESRVFEGRIKPGSVKSRLIEAHPPEASADGVEALLAAVGAEAGLDLEASAGQNLWTLTSPDDVFVVDTLDQRFWLLHTTAPSARLKTLLSRHLFSRTRFDSAWMPPSVLDTLAGDRRLVRSWFTADPLLPVEQREAARARRSRLRFEGSIAPSVLQLLQKHIPDLTALDSVGSLVSEQGLGTAHVVADYRGRFMTKGDSFEAALGAMWGLLDRYRDFVSTLEARHQLRLVTEGDGQGFIFEGEVATFRLPRPVEDLEAFVGGLFSCRDPFRLWAVPREVVAGGFWEANAVDLHVGQTLRLEVTPEEIRVLLPDQTCGNTLARLLVNLQHHFDAHVSLDGLGNPLAGISSEHE